MRMFKFHPKKQICTCKIVIIDKQPTNTHGNVINSKKLLDGDERNLRDGCCAASFGTKQVWEGIKLEASNNKQTTNNGCRNDAGRQQPSYNKTYRPLCSSVYKIQSSDLRPNLSDTITSLISQDIILASHTLKLISHIELFSVTVLPHLRPLVSVFQPFQGSRTLCSNFDCSRNRTHVF